MSRTARAWLIPEVLQSSQMDCGPAALKAVLEGFGIPVHYDALRERCATDVDGTSISALARLAAELGLETYERLVPREDLFSEEARCLPAIVVTRSGAGGLHFVVVWNTWGPFAQILDPQGGRRWLPKQRLLEQVPDIPVAITAERWRRWAASERGRAPLLARLRRLGIARTDAVRLLERARHVPGWRELAALDAGARLVEALHARRSLRRGGEALRVLESALATEGGRTERIPQQFFWPRADEPEAGRLTLHGCVIVHFAARAARVHAPADSPLMAASAAEGAAPEAATAGASTATTLPPSAESELRAPTMRPLRVMFSVARFEARELGGPLALGLLAGAWLVFAEVLLLRALLSADRYLALEYQRLAGVACALLLPAAALWVEVWIGGVVRRIGRGIELRMRVRLLEKLPRLEDNYLRSRPTSDTASRGQATHALRELPLLWTSAARALLMLGGTSAALLWLYPAGAAWIAILAGTATVLPFATRRSLTEISLRLRTHTSALDRFYLDALLGVSPLRVHGAERAVRSGHEELLAEWARAARSLQLHGSAARALQLATSTSAALFLVTGYLRDGGPLGGVLLVAFWALRLPAAAEELVTSQLALRQLRGIALRLLSPLASADSTAAAVDPAPSARAETPPAAALDLDRVTVRANGHTLLEDVALRIEPGTHVGIVGPSGAGKSSLIGLLLGWYPPHSGRVRCDGEELTGASLAALRARTAWVDPSVRIWDRSLYDNIRFGDDDAPPARLPEVLAKSELLELLDELPDGLQENLGEGGVRLSGGQGQRVRLARALLRKHARLVLMDEPFRGLPRERRSALLCSAREHFRHATLLFVSHDVLDTLELDRVVVLESGRIVEDGAPASLAADPDSRYAALVRAERAAHTELWSAEIWRRTVLRDGRLNEPDAP